MNFYITQNITIQKLSIGSISNSSVVQIGTAGMIKPLSQLYNTGGFTGPAPQIGATPPSPQTPVPSMPTLIPLAPAP